MKRYTILQITVLVVFMLGMTLYVLSMVQMPKSFSFEAFEAMKISHALELLGNACMVASIIGATQIRE